MMTLKELRGLKRGDAFYYVSPLASRCYKIRFYEVKRNGFTMFFEEDWKAGCPLEELCFERFQSLRLYCLLPPEEVTA